MVYVMHKYGHNKKEIKNLLRDRLLIKNNIRYHENKAKSWKTKLEDIETKLDSLFSLIEND